MLLDTSVLVELLRAPSASSAGSIVAAMGPGPWFASPVHIAELCDWARREGVPPDDVATRALALVQLVPLDADVAKQASAIKAHARARKHARDFSLLDGIGLASARSRGLPLLTLDAEFEGLDGAVVVRRSLPS